MEFYLPVLMFICALALFLTTSALILAVILIRELHEQLIKLRKDPRVTHHQGLKIHENQIQP